MSTISTDATRDLAAEHLALIAQRETATSGTAAALTRRIVECELRMIVAGVKFTPYVAPTRGKVTLADMNTEDLLSQHTTAIKNRQSATSAGVKAGATVRIKRLEAELDSRGAEYERADLGSGQMSDDTLREQVQAMRAVLKGKLASASVRKLAERTLADLERKASERKLKV